MAKKKSPNNKLPIWVWFLTSLCLIGLLMFLVLLSKLEPHSRVTEKSAEPALNDDDPSTLGHLDFYERLKDAVVPIDARSRNAKNAKPKDDSISLLQVASFKNQKDADELRVKLLLLGLTARIEKATSEHGDTWHRIIVGPFANRSKLQHARSVLLSNRHEALLIKRKPEKG